MTTLYLPVETAARELDGKLLLALFAVARGMNVCLGNRQLLNNRIHRLPPGIYLSHNIDKGRARILALLRKLGHAVVAWDEEGLVWVDGPTYLQRRVNCATLKHVDRFYAWGEAHADVLRERAAALDVEVVAAGNPRADLLSPAFLALYRPRAEELKRELGDFILVNSNFGWLNYALSGDPGAERTRGELAALATKARHPIGYLEHRYAIFRALCGLLPKLSERFADRKIIVRPHPSESPEGWREAAAGLENVSVRYDSDLVPWLLGAGAMIHNGCTTAIESALLGRIPIAYTPVDGGPYEIRQPQAVSAIACTDEDVLSLLERPELMERQQEDLSVRLGALIASHDGKLSADWIADDLAGLKVPGAAGLSAAVAKVAAGARALEKSFSALSSRSPANPAYVDHKFPPIDTAAITKRLERLADLAGKPVPRVEELSDRLFQMRPDSD